MDAFGRSTDGAADEAEEATGVFGRFRKLLSRFKKGGGGEAGLDDFDAAWTDFGKGAERGGMKIEGLARSMFKARIAADAFSTIMRKVGDVISGAGRAVGGFVAEAFGLQHVTNALSSIFSGFVDLAAQVDTLRETMEQLGTNAGIPIDYLNARVRDLQKSGITTAGAYRSLTTWMSQKLPLDNITSLSRAAQDMAVAFGVNSTEAFERFTASIVRGSTELLDIFGVENASLMFDRYARSIDTTANSLTHAQKQQAILNGILKAAEPFAGAYENALDSVGKKMGSLVRKLEEASLKLGQAFLPVLGAVIDRIGEFADAFGEMIEDARPHLDALAVFMERIVNRAGSFIVDDLLPKIASAMEYIHSFIFVARQFGEAIAAIFSGDWSAGAAKLREVVVSIVAFFKLAFGDLVANAIDWGKGVVENLYNGLKEFLLEGESWFSQAFQWGYSFITELSSGIIDAANTILSQVLTYIGNIIASFLAPGSPPERGPLSTMDTWGAGLMLELADGMASISPGEFERAAGVIGEGISTGLTKTFRDLGLKSFEMIRGTMSLFQRALQGMVGLGEIEETELVPHMQELRNLMVELGNVFEDTGAISEEVLDSIGEKFGEQGDDIKEYLRLQLQLRKAQEELADLDQQIAAAEQAGFASEGLRQKRAAKADEVDALTERFKLQKEILDFQAQGNSLMIQQMKLLERIAKANERAAAAAEKAQKDPWEEFLKQYNEELALLEEKKRLGLISEEEYMRGRLALEARYIDTAIRLGKPLTQERIDAYLALKKAVEDLKGGGGKGVKGLADESNKLWDDWVAGFGDAKTDAKDLAELLENEVGGSFNQATQNFLEARKEVGGLFEGVSFDIDLPFLDKIAAGEGIWGLLFVGLDSALDSVSETLGEWLPKIIDGLKTGLSGVGALIGNFFSEVIGGTGLGAIWDALANSGRLIMDALGGAFQRIKDAWNEVFGSSGVIQTGGVDIVATLGNIGTKIGQFIDGVAHFIARVIGFIGPIFSRFGSLLGEVFVGIIEFFGNFINRMRESEALQIFMERLSQVITGLWTGALRPVLNVLSIAVGAIATAAVALVDGIANAMGPFAHLIADILELLLNIANIVSTVVYGAIDTLVTLITQGPEEALGKLEGYLGDIGASIVGALENVAEGLLHAFQTVASLLIGVVDGIVGMITGKFGVVNELFDGFGDQINNIIGLVGQKLGIKSKKGVDKFSGSFEDLAANVAASADGYDDYIEKLEEAKELHADEIDQNGIRIEQIGTLTVAQFNLANALDAEAEAAEREGRSTTEYVNKKQEALDLIADLERANYKMGAAAMSANSDLIAQTEAERDLILQTIKADDFIADFARGQGLLTDELHETNMALQEQEQQAYEAGKALDQAAIDMAAAFDVSSDEVGRLLEGQKTAQREYQAERKAILAEGNAEELAELDRRYAEESAKRKAAIAEALLDLNERILREKLMREELTGAEAAVIVAQHREQAEQIVSHYDLQGEKARLMSEEAIGSLRAAALSHEEFVGTANATLPEVLDLLDSLEEDGYEGLSATAKEQIDAMVGFLIAMPADTRPSMEEMAGIIGLLPEAYQGALLEMLDEDATVDEIIEAFEELGKVKAEPEVEITIKKRGAAGKDLELLSPKTQMQEALENLVKYAERNAVEVSIDMVGASIEDIVMVRDSVEALIDIEEALMIQTVETEETFTGSAKKMLNSFRRAMSEIRRSGEEAMRKIVRAGHRMKSELMGIAHALRGQFVDAMRRMGEESAAAFVVGMLTIEAKFQAFFVGGKWTGLDIKFYDWGLYMMKKFADGIIRGKHTYVDNALRIVKSQMPSSVPKKGPLAFEPDWSYLTEGLADQAAYITSVMSDFEGRNFSGLPRSGMAAPAPAGNVMHFHSGAFENAFPNVRGEDDALALVRALNSLTERGTALGRIGGL
jgi:hypothetical protein